MNRNDLLPVFNGDRIDMIALMKNIWVGRRIVITIFLVFVLLGLLVAIFSPVKYRSGSVLLPQAEEQQDLGQLGGLASLAGFNLNNMLGGAAGISPDLYPSIVGSYPFLDELVSSEYVFEDEPKAISLYEKIEKDRRENVWLKYTIRLPWTLKNLIFPQKERAIIVEGSNADKLVVISKIKASIHEEVLNSISIDVVAKTGLVSIVIEHEDAYASAQIAQNVVDLLQDYIINYKTSQVRNSLEFAEERYEETKVAFEKAQQIYFNYQDAHRNRVSERAETRFQELADEYSLTRTLYQNLAQQVEQTRLSVKKETPVFTVIEPVKVPVEKAVPRRTVIMVTYLIIGFFVGLLLLYAQIVFKDIQTSWRKKIG
jgi:hypothetical protein